MSREFKTKIDAPSFTVGTSLTDVSLTTHNHGGSAQTSLQVIPYQDTAVTITAPPGATEISSLLLIAGGGSGGPGTGTTGATAVTGGGGGAGGGMVIVNNIPVSPGETFTASIGAGGSGVTAGSALGIAGGDTTFTVRGTTYTAKGGGAGSKGGALGSPGARGTGTLGTATGSALNFTPTGLAIAGANGGNGGDGDNNPAAVVGSDASSNNFSFDQSSQFFSTVISGYGGGGGGGGGAGTAAGTAGALAGANGGNGGGGSGGNGNGASSGGTGATVGAFGAGSGGGGGRSNATTQTGGPTRNAAHGAALIVWDAFVDSWQGVLISDTNTINDIEYSEQQDKMVVVGDGGLIETSSDGVSWTAQTSNVTSNINSIKFSKNQNIWAAVTEDKKVLTSSDAVTWTSTAPTATALTTFRHINYNEKVNQWLIVGSRNTAAGNPQLPYLISTAATIGWTQQNMNNLFVNLGVGAFKSSGTNNSNGLWILIPSVPINSGLVSNPLLRSSDLTINNNGTPFTAITACVINTVQFDTDDQQWTVTGYGYMSDGTTAATSLTNRIATSSDGTTWTRGTASTALPAYGIAYSPYHKIWAVSHFNAYTNTANSLYKPYIEGPIGTSSDGITWSRSIYNKDICNNFNFNVMATSNFDGLQKILWNSNLRKWFGFSQKYVYYITDIQ